MYFRTPLQVKGKSTAVKVYIPLYLKSSSGSGFGMDVDGNSSWSNDSLIRVPSSDLIIGTAGKEFVVRQKDRAWLLLRVDAMFAESMKWFRHQLLLWFKKCKSSLLSNAGGTPFGHF